MDFDNETIKFNMFEMMRYPVDTETCFRMSTTGSIAQKYFELMKDDVLETVISQGIGVNKEGNFQALEEISITHIDKILEQCNALQGEEITGERNFVLPKTSSEKQLPSVVQAPQLDLKPLPSHLMYVFLGKDETLPIIISSKLTSVQEEKVVELVRNYIKAIGWSSTDIRGTSPTLCVHRIHLEEGAKPVRIPQRRLNPPMMEVVKKEVIKLLDNGIIYPISDSKWVSTVHVVPKKSGITVVENEENELVPQRTVTGHRVCIDYRPLNNATRKDHFPLSFID
ncbi:hypothetical protein DCAR_0519939 [Daucus carota subsp. sativus]|uniref:Reverse transcriptase domain-containing protein n=1 Tax=Daucus carota subsp. sativus TaxID=79200 RepID=A0AAF0X2V4_DAUCS|nr:hypothetical protein DCAR_0519939 [Daucus carota subsp. sativus]